MSDRVYCSFKEVEKDPNDTYIIYFSKFSCITGKRIIHKEDPHAIGSDHISIASRFNAVDAHEHSIMIHNINGVPASFNALDLWREAAYHGYTLLGYEEWIGQKNRR
jgi:hypothetical protein